MEAAGAAFEPHRLEPLEVSSGRVLGRRRAPEPAIDREWPVESPAAVLEHFLLEALSSPPCVVAFSGGRDSSAILAEATRAARVHGLDDPIPFTLRFPGAPRTSEDEWQEMVVRHLGLDEWQSREVTNELDALGPIALDVLLRHGVHWPANVHTLRLLMEPATGGSLVTGNGGDELFGEWAGRRIAQLRRGRALPRRSDLRPLARYLMPNALLARRRGFQLRWLTPAAARKVGRGIAAELTRVDRDWAKALDTYLDSRYLEVILGLAAAIARGGGVKLVEPFYHPRYIRSVCADAPRDGYPSRTVAMERLFGDLLPDKVPARSGKAVFTEVFCGPETRRFATQWDGRGLDPDLVDAEALRAEWLAPVPDFRSLVPMQAAWLASESARSHPQSPEFG